MAEQGIRHHRAASSGQFPLINGIGAGWYEKDCATYGYEFGSWKSRFDLFDAGLERIEARLGQLIPPGPQARYPSSSAAPAPSGPCPLWHAHLPLEAFTEASARVEELVLAAGRSGNDIERSVHCSARPARGLPRHRRQYVHHRDRLRRHHRSRLQHLGGNAGLA
jgi:hypothetical protein